MGKSEDRAQEKTQSFKEVFFPKKKDIFQLNLVLLLTHVAFLFWYWSENMPILFGYNVFSILVFIQGFYLIRNGKERRLLAANFVEIFTFMTVNLWFLGWEYGFQIYCFGFLISALLTDFLLNNSRKLYWFTKAFIAAVILYFVFMRSWFYTHEPYYTHGTAIARECLYILNAVMTMILILNFILMYTKMVYELEDRLNTAATHDELTGLKNRRYMQQNLDQLNFSEKRDCSYFIGILDVDKFKMINDTFGHAAGDKVLVELAGILCSFEDKYPQFQACRWGGEEFLLLCCEEKREDPEQIRKRFDQLRRQIEKENTIFEGAEIPWTVTIGVCDGIACDSVEAMLKIADEQLYFGKEKGRNQVVMKKSA